MDNVSWGKLLWGDGCRFAVLRAPRSFLIAGRISPRVPLYWLRTAKPKFCASIWITTYIHFTLWYVITQPWPNYDDGFSKTPVIITAWVSNNSPSIWRKTCQLNFWHLTCWYYWHHHWHCFSNSRIAFTRYTCTTRSNWNPADCLFFIFVHRVEGV